jgi:GTPase SAR1 family protein
MEVEVRLRHPFTAVVSGPTSCGKTVFVFRLIENVNEMITAVPSKVIYCYGEYQSLFDNYPQIEFHEGLPDMGMFDGVPTLLILDDLMGEANDAVTKLFTKVSHHRNVSVIYLTQNILYKSQRTISLNSHYIVLFKNPRDAGQVSTLALQMYPGDNKFVIEAFTDATSTPHSYLLFDLRPEQNEKLRLRSNIFPDQEHCVYVRK